MMLSLETKYLYSKYQRRKVAWHILAVHAGGVRVW